jgi:hypothetical protein
MSAVSRAAFSPLTRFEAATDDIMGIAKIVMCGTSRQDEKPACPILRWRLCA